MRSAIFHSILPRPGRPDLGPDAVVEGAARGGNGEVDVGLVTLGHIGDHRPGGRIIDGEGLAGCGLHQLAVDQHPGFTAEKSARRDAASNQA